MLGCHAASDPAPRHGVKESAWRGNVHASQAALHAVFRHGTGGERNDGQRRLPALPADESGAWLRSRPSRASAVHEDQTKRCKTHQVHRLAIVRAHTIRSRPRRQQADSHLLVDGVVVDHQDAFALEVNGLAAQFPICVCYQGLSASKAQGLARQQNGVEHRLHIRLMQGLRNVPLSSRQTPLIDGLYAHGQAHS